MVVPRASFSDLIRISVLGLDLPVLTRHSISCCVGRNSLEASVRPRNAWITMSLYGPGGRVVAALFITVVPFTISSFAGSTPAGCFHIYLFVYVINLLMIETIVILKAVRVRVLIAASALVCTLSIAPIVLGSLMLHAPLCLFCRVGPEASHDRLQPSLRLEYTGAVLFDPLLRVTYARLLAPFSQR